MRAVLRKELDLPIIDIADKTAMLDGGDVLFTGQLISFSFYLRHCSSLSIMISVIMFFFLLMSSPLISDDIVRKTFRNF